MVHWLTTRTYVDSSMNRALSTSILQSLGLIYFLLILWIWLTVETKTNLMNTLMFTDNLSPYKRNMFHLIDLRREVVVLSYDPCSSYVIFWDNVSPNQWKKLRLIDFLRQSVTKIGEFFHLKRSSDTIYLTHLNSNLNIYSPYWRPKRVIDSFFYG